MAVIDDLLQKVEDPVLRDRLAKEIHRATKHKKFGLVFEEHLPECTPLWGIPVKKGSKVALRTGKISNFYTVLGIKDDVAICLNMDKSATVEFPVDDLVCIAEFGEPIYPYLKPVDTVCNAPDSSLWHTLIEADNYHALQLLEYLYAGKVDCIYIDPPYNTGARDWKYNNDYVDSNDQYRHSKWLSFMERRLKLAKHLLNPQDSVLIVTIDEKEYLHLGCMLEDIFPEARMQMISSVIKVGGSKRYGEFSRSGEFIFFIMLGNSVPRDVSIDMSRGYETKEKKRENVVSWQGLRRRGGDNWERKFRPNLFYPVFLKSDTKEFVGVGEAPSLETKREDVSVPDGTFAVWPLAPDGQEGRWQISQERFIQQYKDGTLIINSADEKTGFASILYLKSGDLSRIEKGILKKVGKNAKGQTIFESTEDTINTIKPGTIWNMPYHDASTYGTLLMKKFLPNCPFSYPKSLYAVHDCIDLFVKNKPNALIVDFFAGSGTTRHAVNLLNAEDGGHRRCIMVTNNEVSDAEAKVLTKQGYRPGDDEWEKLGIARYVTWPRTVCSIEGHDVNGRPLKGKYFGSDAPMSDGFKANAAYFKLGFLDRNAVALGRQFRELLPVLWMKAGATGTCPQLEEYDDVPNMMVLPQNRMAVLNDDTAFAQFEEQVRIYPEIETVYIVTDSERGYREMIRTLDVKNTYQLYRNYLDNFKINHRR